MSGETRLRDVDPLHGGQVEFILDHAGDDAPRSGLVIRRGAQTNPFLGPDGWQQVEHAFDPTEAYREKGNLVLRYGRDVVDNALRDDDIIQVSFPELDVTDVLTWSGITRSVSVTDRPSDGGGGVQPPQRPELAFGGEDHAGRPTLVLQGVPEGTALGALIRREDPDTPFLGPDGWQATEHRFVPEARRDGDGRVVLTLDPGETAGQAAAGQTVTIAVPELDLETRATWPGTPRAPTVPPDGSKGYLRPALIAALLLLIVGLGAWWVLSDDPDPEPLPQEEIAGAPAEPETPEPALPDEPETDLAPGQAAYERAIAARDAGDCPAARQDMLTAVDAEYGPALLAWAEAQDSVDFEPCLTETENDVSAVEHFSRACEAGADGAPESLATFVAALETRADAGDPVAAEVLRLAIPPALEICNP